MLTVLMQSVANASFGIYFPKFLGTIYEHLSAPVSFLEIIIGYVGAAATKSFIIGMIILITSSLFVPLNISHPVWMIALLVINCVTFSLLGFIIGILSNNFEQLNLVPMLIITPLVFLGGSFYALEMLPSFWQTVTLFNPVMYLISVFRWAFFDVADVPIFHSFLATLVFSITCTTVIYWIFKTGYKLKN
jgi:ABC-2 type transport system permease protein